MRNGRAASDPLAEFVRLWERLRSDCAEPGTVVVVEGERDLVSLRRLGLTGAVIKLHHGRALSGTAHDLVGRSRHVIVLTDWDTEGGHLAQRLREFLEAERLALDLDYRRRFARVCTRRARSRRGPLRLGAPSRRAERALPRRAPGRRIVPRSGR